jgi:hypothetical protein
MLRSPLAAMIIDVAPRTDAASTRKCLFYCTFVTNMELGVHICKCILECVTGIYSLLAMHMWKYILMVTAIDIVALVYITVN